MYTACPVVRTFTVSKKDTGLWTWEDGIVVDEIGKNPTTT